MFSKKYLDKDYILHLTKSILLYNDHKQALSFIPAVKKYIIANRINLTNYFKTDVDDILKALNYIIYNIDTISPEIIKQNIINQVEKKGDFYLNTVKTFLEEAFNTSDINESLIFINKEWKKIIKYIVMVDTIKNLAELEKKYFSEKDIEKEVESAISKLFDKIEEITDKKEINIEGINDIEKIIDELKKEDGEFRPFRLFESMKIAETRRVITVIGPSGLGKSMLLCSVASDYLTNPIYNDNTKKIVFYFSAENTREETLNRIIANVTDITINEVKNSRNDISLKSKIIKEWKEKINPNMVLSVIELEAGIHTTTTMISFINKTLKKYPNSIPFVVIVDYIERFRSIRGDDRRIELGEIVNDLRNLALEYNVPVFTAAQLNRTGVKKVVSGKNPDITDIGESWKIIENSDVAIILEGEMTGQVRNVSFGFKKHRYFEAGKSIHAKYIPSKAKFTLYEVKDVNIDINTYEDLEENNDILFEL